MKKLLTLVVLVAVSGCLPTANKKPQMSLFVGIDVSGSFYRSGQFEDALDFLSEYIYGHLEGKGDLKPLKALFVGAIGGQVGDETKSFRPIHDFQGKSVAQIRANLSKWFPQADTLTDFNVFFETVAGIAKKRNLALSPITIVLLSDGKPDFPGKTGDTFANINLKDLEYLSRRVTLRLLYADPVVSNKWETEVPRRRVRMWTVDKDVMAGWKNQFVESPEPVPQPKLWKWIIDNVDFRVKRKAIF